MTESTPPPGATSTRLAEHRTSLADARSHLANERTHLAYLRTALSLMSFGITINRFSIFLQKDSGGVIDQASFPLRDAENVGLGMVVVGIALLIWALVRYRRVHREIVEARFAPSSTSVTLLTLAIIALGAVSAVWLLVS